MATPDSFSKRELHFEVGVDEQVATRRRWEGQCGLLEEGPKGGEGGGVGIVGLRAIHAWGKAERRQVCQWAGLSLSFYGWWSLTGSRHSSDWHIETCFLIAWAVVTYRVRHIKD